MGQAEAVVWGDKPRHYSRYEQVEEGMKTYILAGTALCGLLLGGCVVPGPGPRYATRTEVIIEEDDYDYYPGYEVYYSRSHGYYYYRDGSAWVRRNDPPRGWVNASVSVQMHFRDAPAQHHAEVIQQYPRNWHSPAQVAPVASRKDDKRGKKDKQDKRDRDEDDDKRDHDDKHDHDDGRDHDRK